MSEGNHHAPLDLSKLTPLQHGIIHDALKQTTFNFASLMPGLVAQTRRDTIPILFRDLSKMQKDLDKAEKKDGKGHDDHDHKHEKDGDDEAHPIIRTIDNRKQVLGLAWYSGKVEIELSLQNKPELAKEVFLAELAHMVDFFFMTPEQRGKIFTVFHKGDATPHDHGWFEETGNEDYWSWVGEAFMSGFVMAFSTIKVTMNFFDHPTTPEMALQIKHILQPQIVMIVARHVKSTIFHRIGGWHERQINDAFQEYFATLAGAQAKGLRKCKTCRWKGL